MENLDRDKAYTIEEAKRLLKGFPALKFDQTVEITLHLGIDGRQLDQILRGTVMLPHGTGKDIRVLVIRERRYEAEEAGADYVGGADLVAKIEGGWLDFDLVVALPDMMGQVGKLGRVLGPRVVDVNPKTGTVTREVGQAVRDAKAGRVEYRADSKSGNNAQAPVGKLSFEAESLVENVKAFTEAIMRAKPASAKGQFVNKQGLVFGHGTERIVPIARSCA